MISVVQRTKIYLYRFFFRKVEMRVRIHYIFIKKIIRGYWLVLRGSLSLSASNACKSCHFFLQFFMPFLACDYFTLHGDLIQKDLRKRKSRKWVFSYHAYHYLWHDLAFLHAKRIYWMYFCSFSSDLFGFFVFFILFCTLWCLDLQVERRKKIGTFAGALFVFTCVGDWHLLHISGQMSNDIMSSKDYGALNCHA